jgi:hypothetical protein
MTQNKMIQPGTGRHQEDGKGGKKSEKINCGNLKQVETFCPSILIKWEGRGKKKKKKRKMWIRRFFTDKKVIIFLGTQEMSITYTSKFLPT